MEIRHSKETLEKMLSDSTPDISVKVNDLAGIYIQAQFEDESLQDVNYGFWLVENSGTWELIYIDDYWM